MGSTSCQQKLMSKLNNNKDAAVVAAASASLCNLGADSPTIIQALKGDSKVKSATLSALSRRVQEANLADDLVKPIADLVGDENSQVRIASANFICAIGSDKASSQAQDIGKLLSSNDVGVRACAATALASIGEAASSQADLLKSLLTD